METICKVLVVDDEMLVRQGIKHLLDWESEGFSIVGEASNGKEALEQIAVLQPHILLTDIVMPVMDGDELARKVKKLYPDMEIVVLSSFGDFEYVRSTFQSGAADYILKPKLDAGELLAVLKSTAQRIPALRHMQGGSKKGQSVDHLLERLISGYPAEYDPGLMKEAFPFPAFVLLTAEEEGAAAAEEEQARSERRELTEARLSELIAASCSPCAIRLLTPIGKRLRLLVNVGAGRLDDLIRMAERIAHESREDGRELLLMVSGEFTDLNKLHDVYNGEISQLFDHRFFLPGTNPLFAGMLTQEKAAAPEFDSESFDEELNRQEFLPAFDRLRTYADAISGGMDADPFVFKSFLGHTLFTIILALGRAHYKADSLDRGKYDYFRSIHESRHIGEAVALLEKFLREAEECMRAASRPGVNPGMQKLLEYIDEHYAEPLCLTEIARHFHFNPSYLSSYFTVHNKEGFSEYLNRVRIDKAGELLREGTESIAEVSARVGYSDQSYFTKVFRKHKGLSPSQYRKLEQEGGD